jgi:hypothetical protein
MISLDRRTAIQHCWSLVNRLLAVFGIRLVRLHRLLMTKNIEEFYATRRRELAEVIGRETGMVVQSGPFSGMRLARAVSWGDGDLAPKLLGTYESELHDWIEDAVAARYEMVINIGCAEGFYAVGLSRRMPDAVVHAFDSDADAREACIRNARQNGAEFPVKVEGHCNHARLESLLSNPRRAFVIVDCEGCERELLNPQLVPSLRHADVLVECHDFLGRGTTEELQRRFAATHAIQMIREGGRDPNRFDILRRFSSLDRWLAVSEGRSERMHWMFCRSNHCR